MLPDTAPENAASRVQRRRRAGARALFIGLGVLLAAGLFYLAVYTVMRNHQLRCQVAAVNDALQTGNVQLAETLLEQSKNNPAMSKYAHCFKWQKRLQEAKDRRQLRKKIFRQKLDALKKILIAGKVPSGDSPELTAGEIAYYASGDDELAELRSLQQHCETLSRIGKLQAAGRSIAELRILKAAVNELSSLRKRGMWQQYHQTELRCRKLFAQNMMQQHELPEIAAQTELLRAELNREIEKGRAAGERFRKEKSAWQEMLKALSAEDLKNQGKNFLQQYPQSIYAPKVRLLLQDLDWLLIDRRKNLQQELTFMQNNLERSRQCWQQGLRKIMAEELRENLFELALQTADPLQPQLKRWETREKSSFRSDGKNGRMQITFSALSGEKLTGTFMPDGSGEISDGRSRWQGKLLNCQPRGDLPAARWQELLLQLEADLSSGKAEDLPVYMLDCRKQFAAPGTLLPLQLQKKLTAAAVRAEQLTGGSWHEYIFKRKFLKFCILNTPVFAGTVQLDPSGKYHIPPPGSLPANGTLWLIASRRGQKIFLSLGSRKNKRSQIKNPPLPPQRKVCILCMPQNGADWQPVLKRFRREAGLKKLPMPPLPDFLR